MQAARELEDLERDRRTCAAALTPTTLRVLDEEIEARRIDRLLGLST